MMGSKFFVGGISTQVSTGPTTADQYNETWTLYADTEAEAVGYMMAKNKEKYPKGVVVSWHITDVSENAMAWAKDRIAQGG